MMKSIVVLFAAGLLFSGCSDGGDSDVPAPSAVPAPATVDAQPSSDASAFTPPVASPVALPPTQPGQPAAAPASSGSGILDNVDKDYIHHLVNLNSAYQGFRSIEMRSPHDLNELVTSKRIDVIPPAPPGKIYKIDEPNLRIILVNK